MTNASPELAGASVMHDARVAELASPRDEAARPLRRRRQRRDERRERGELDLGQLPVV
jgi:hypothetical protein